MIKKILGIFLLCVIGVSAYVYISLSDSKVLITPYPYSFQEKYINSFKKEHAEQIKMAENAQILVLGDDLGHSLNPYFSRIQSQYTDYLKSSDSIFNWSSPKEPLFRSLFKLKTLSKLPPVIIYVGSNSELTEQKFSVKDKELIDTNFQIYEDEKLISLIITFPFLSKILYHKVQYFNLSSPKPYVNLQNSVFKQKEKELNFKIYSYETEDLIKHVKRNKSDIIFISTPINLMIPPKVTCAHTQNEMIIENQQYIEKLINSGSYKIALLEIEKYKETSFSNAQNSYLEGIANLRNGSIQKGKDNLHLAAIYDCENWRSNQVYNKILENKAKKHHAYFVDFDNIANAHIGKDGVFLDETYPHNVIYIQLINELNQILKTIFKSL